VQMFMALGHQSRVECAQGGNVPSRFVMQSFTTAAGTAHISNKLRADARKSASVISPHARVSSAGEHKQLASNGTTSAVNPVAGRPEKCR
jgi:hypothetical protein